MFVGGGPYELRLYSDVPETSKISNASLQRIGIEAMYFSQIIIEIMTTLE